jgi:hypothetical protein
VDLDTLRLRNLVTRVVGFSVPESEDVKTWFVTGKYNESVLGPVEVAASRRRQCYLYPIRARLTL